MLGARNVAKSAETLSISASVAIGVGAWIVRGAKGPGAEAWLTWQTWQVASSDAVLCRCVSEPVVSETMASAIAMARMRRVNLLGNIADTLA